MNPHGLAPAVVFARISNLALCLADRPLLLPWTPPIWHLPGHAASIAWSSTMNCEHCAPKTATADVLVRAKVTDNPWNRGQVPIRRLLGMWLWGHVRCTMRL